MPTDPSGDLTLSCMERLLCNSKEERKYWPRMPKLTPAFWETALASLVSTEQLGPVVKVSAWSLACFPSKDEEPS